MQAKEIFVEQGSADWLALRKDKIGSSDASIILEKSKWMSPYQLWCQKLDLLPPLEENAAMKRGKDMEPIARGEFERLTGISMTPKVFVKDFMIASMDGVDQENRLAVEIKVPGRVDHECAMDGVVPEHYYPQLQHQMMVMGLPMIYYFSYNESSNKLIEVSHDKKFCDILFDKETNFWKNVQTLEAPPLIDKDYRQRIDATWNELSSEWLTIIQMEKEIEMKKLEIRNRLIMEADGKNCKGRGIKISFTTRKGSIDYNQIPELKNLDLDKYRKPKSAVWTIREE